MADPEEWNGHHDRDVGDEEGDVGYRLEIAQVKGLILPLEESVAAARAMGRDEERLTGYLRHAGAPEILHAGQEFVSSWGFGMRQLAEHADEVVDRLYEAVAAYMLAEILQVENFWPSDANIAKLPIGDASTWAAKKYGVPEMDPRPGESDHWKKFQDFVDED
ncbi:hypothetical protein H8N01_05050 [Streptomyces sp. AC536]|uniref:hypothetical protein n=1 Tax=Streptomyces buecherae TaxID=2763006 RepID=UPI00164EBC21|nr:hypothetical protein [Streptomyces buecherae]MBC3981946.1 hypothetical protein [Streptomyces buecherae]QNJ41820.1 hypothetical protein H7H31_20070 [Streptomyces buecherae]